MSKRTQAIRASRTLVKKDAGLKTNKKALTKKLVAQGVDAKEAKSAASRSAKLTKIAKTQGVQASKKAQAEMDRKATLGSGVEAPAKQNNTLGVLSGQAGKRAQARSDVQRAQLKQRQKAQKARVTTHPGSPGPEEYLRATGPAKAKNPGYKKPVTDKEKVVIKLKDNERLLAKPDPVKKEKKPKGNVLSKAVGAVRDVADKAFDVASDVATITQKRDASIRKRMNPKGKKNVMIAAASPADPKPVVKAAKVASRTVLNTTQVVTEDLKKQVPKLVGDIGKSVIAAPAGAVQMAKDPKKAWKDMKEDYSRRYGDLVSDDPKANEKFMARQRKEGVSPEAFDIFGGASVGGATAGRVLTVAAKAGKLGKKAERVATSDPKPIRVTGGEEGTKERKRSKNLFVAVGQEGTDKVRRKVQARRVEKGRALPHEITAQKKGEVSLISRKRSARLQKKDGVARGKAIGLNQARLERHREVNQGVDKTYANLKGDERPALKYAMEFGIRSPGQAVSVLSKHLANIEAERTRRAAKGKPVDIGHTDEVPVLKKLIADEGKAFTARVAEAADVEKARVERVGKGDPGLTTKQAATRSVAKQAELLGLERRKGEKKTAFAARVREAADEADGLAPGAYYPSKTRPEGVFMARTLGNTGMRRDRRRTGELSKTGRESADPRLLSTAVARNIRRKHNWKFVTDTMERNAYEVTRKADGDGMSMTEAKNAVEREFGKDALERGDVVLVNPGVINKAAKSASKKDTDIDIESDLGDGRISDAISEATATARRLENAKAETTRGWVAVDRAVYEELTSSSKSGGKYGRMFDIGKGKMSRVILAHPAWLSFQVASNGLLTGLSGTGPKSIIDAHRWWRGLTDGEKAAIEPMIGIHPWVDQQTKLGAASTSNMVNTWRAMKQTPWWQQAHKANPLDLIFRADNAQNNFWRRAVFYNKAKKEAYRRMNERTPGMVSAQNRLQHMFDLDPQGQIRAMVKERKTIERLARDTEAFLGDYMTYTAAERRYLSRAVMFYGFLRFSLKFSMYTMPIKHPIMSSIILQIGRMHKDEVDRLFGGEAPPWEYGKVFLGDKSFDLARMNPWLNATQYFNFTDRDVNAEILASVAPPFAQAALNQMSKKNVGMDKNWDMSSDNVTNRAWAFFNDAFIKPSALNRTLERTGIPGVAEPLYGKQHTDSNLLRPRPKVYKDDNKRKLNDDIVAEEKKKGFAGRLRESLVPMAGKDSKAAIARSKDYIEDRKLKAKRDSLNAKLDALASKPAAKRGDIGRQKVLIRVGPNGPEYGWTKEAQAIRDQIKALAPAKKRKPTTLSPKKDPADVAMEKIDKALDGEEDPMEAVWRKIDRELAGY